MFMDSHFCPHRHHQVNRPLASDGLQSRGETHFFRVGGELRLPPAGLSKGAVHSQQGRYWLINHPQMPHRHGVIKNVFWSGPIRMNHQNALSHLEPTSHPPHAQTQSLKAGFSWVRLCVSEDGTGLIRLKCSCTSILKAVRNAYTDYHGRIQISMFLTASVVAC